MGKIRDFIYNSSDIFLALIILAAAGFLIWTRIQVIMAYPDSYAPSQTVQQEVQEDQTTTESAVTSESSITSEGAVGTQDDADAVTPPLAPASITIEIPEGATAEDVAQLLHEAGLVAEPDDFLYTATQMNKYGSMKSGAITIDSGSTLEQIVEAVSN